MRELPELQVTLSDAEKGFFGILDQATRAYLLYPFTALADVVLFDPAFVTAPGGASHHHAYKGGLLQHTSEVVAHVIRVAGPVLDMPSLILAAIWHDYMKTREYVIEPDGRITKTQYHAQIGHVAGSYVEFVHHARRLGVPDTEIEKIGHIMLAHHGRLEWRSPVEPQTPEAFILHTADMLSARGA